METTIKAKTRRPHLQRATTGLALFAVVILSANALHAQTGVSGDRVSLPEGPGSLEGVGENVNIDPNMGLMRYRIPIEVPEGFPGLTPSVGIVYSSGAGNSVVGVGWDMPSPFIERTVSRGVPFYNDDDLFAADGSALLVRIPGTEPPIYRARHEGSFIRYTWLDRGEGDDEGREGFWRAEWPDGRVGYYGANSEGDLVQDSRVSDPRGTFRYHLVEMEDVWGHKLRYTHRLSDNTAIITRIEWVFIDQTPRFAVAFDYEDRNDIDSDARPGFETRLSERLTGIRVFNGQNQLQRYALSYEDPNDSGGVSRLARFERFGLRGDLFEAVLNFDYSSALGGVCEGEGCLTPFLVDMGRVGGSFQGGTTTLVDINGDALPDVVNTPVNENHRFFVNVFDGPQDQSFEEVERSQFGENNTHFMPAGNVELLDVDGDGFTDLINIRTGLVLENKGQGDWTQLFNLFDQGEGNLGDLQGDVDNDGDPSDGNLLTTRFLDYDNDKKIDVIRVTNANPGVTQLYRNTGAGGFVLDEGADNIALGVGFDSDIMDLTDINGDGLLEPVRLDLGSLSYQLNLGLGQWGEPTQINDLPFDNDIERQLVEFEDLNNDGRADLVLVIGDEVRYSLGRNGELFDDPVTLNSDNLGFSIPSRINTTVLYADMNGSGSSDIVWIDLQGNVSYLELFPVQPHLLTRIENGLGMVQAITYGTSVEQAARDANEGNPWLSKLPHAMSVVTQIDIFDTLGDLHEVTELIYHEGFYDGIEKSFRGFEAVETLSPGDDFIEAGLTQLRYDVGAADPYRAGLNLSQAIFTGERLVQTLDYTYDDCDVDELGDLPLAFDVRYICQTSLQTTVLEGLDPQEGARSTQNFVYDGYGNISRLEQLGVTSLGEGQACEPCQRSDDVFGSPCGPQCTGDEQITEITYVEPDNTAGRWMLDRPARVKISGRAQSDQTHEKVFHYDGEPFVGLPEGQLTHGAPTRIRVKLNTEGDLIDDLRQRIDDNGRVTEVLLPDGSVDVADDQRFVQIFDDEGLAPTAFEYLMIDPEGEPYRLRQELQYDDIWARVNEISNWIVMRDGQPQTPLITESVLYDQFGRVETRFFPNDALDEPSERLTYELANPTSRVLIEQRSERGGPFDLQTARCFDGFGRLYQERTRVAEGAWIVNGFIQHNARGQAARVFGRFESDTGDCDTAPPEGVAFLEVSVDALRRPLSTVFNAGDVRRERRFEYSPLFTIEHDPEDTDPDSPHAGTPTRYDHDGLGRRTATHRQGNGDTHTWTFTYNELGHYRGSEDPQGNAIVQAYDLAGRLTQVDDPDRGTTVYEHDAAGRPTHRTNALGLTMRYEYDTMGRLTATWDDVAPEASRVNYRYDQPADCSIGDCTNPAGKLIETDFPVEEGARGAYWYGYDANDNRVFMARHIRDQQFDFSWDYNNVSDVVERGFPDGRALTYTYDGARRLQSIPGVLDAIGYDGASRLDALQFANGAVEALAWNSEDRLEAIEVLGANDALLAERRLAFDGVGNILSVADDALDAQRPSAGATHTYDDFYRLTEARLDAGRGGFDETLSYTYDSIDNITSKVSDQGAESPAHVGGFTYGQNAGPHAVTQAGELNMTYNAVGSMSRRGEVAIQHDCFGRVGGADLGQRVLRYAYGPSQQRVLQIDGDSTTWVLGDHYEIRDGVALIHVEFGGRRLASLQTTDFADQVLSDLAPLQNNAPDPDGEINVGDALIAYLAEEGVIDLGDTRRDHSQALLIAALEGLLAEGDEPHFLHADHQGNVIATTDAAGQLTEARAYYPFGLQRQPEALISAAGFNNQTQDNDFGLINFDARLLDPKLGRWITPDPLFQTSEGPHTAFLAEVTGAYAAMVNNPTTMRDNDGMSVSTTAGVFSVDAALNRAAYASAGLATALATLATDQDKDNEHRMNTPDGRRIGSYGNALHTFGGSGGAIPGYFTSGASGLTSLGRSGTTQAIFARHTRATGLTGQQTLDARRAVSSAVTSSLGVSSVGAMTTTGAGALPVSGLAGTSQDIKPIANGAAHHSGQARLLSSLQKLSRKDSRAARTGDRALTTLGASLGSGQSRLFGGTTASLSATFDQTRRHQSQLGANKGGSAAGRASKQALTQSEP